MKTPIQALHALYSRASNLYNRLESESLATAVADRFRYRDRLQEVWLEQSGYGEAILKAPVVDELDELICLTQLQFEIETFEDKGVDPKVFQRMNVAIENVIAARWRALGKPDLGNGCSNSTVRICNDRSLMRHSDSEISLAA